jgi:hypothetical protein
VNRATNGHGDANKLAAAILLIMPYAPGENQHFELWCRAAASPTSPSEWGNVLERSY